MFPSLAQSTAYSLHTRAHLNSYAAFNNRESTVDVLKTKTLLRHIKINFPQHEGYCVFPLIMSNWLISKGKWWPMIVKII